MKLETDSGDYDVLQRAAARCASKGAFLEIGTRSGGSTEILLNEVEPGGVVISIDPYGSLPYLAFGVAKGSELQMADSPDLIWQWCHGADSGLDYTNRRRTEAMVNLFEAAENLSAHFVPLPFDDAEFMRRFPDGVPVYGGGHKLLVNMYGLVFLDGPHDTESVLLEIAFFVPRLAAGGEIVIDDWLPRHRRDAWDRIMDRWNLQMLDQSQAKLVLGRRGEHP